MAKFQRTKFRAYVKLGKGQKSKQSYRKATGRHNKIREKQKGRPPRVEIGYKNETGGRGLINNKLPVLVNCLKDLEKVKKENIIIIGKIGDKNKEKIAKEIQKKGFDVDNLNIKKFLKKIEKTRAYKLKKKQEKSKNNSEKKKQEKVKEEKKIEEKNKDETKGESK